MHEGQNLDTHKIWERGGLGETPGGMWVLPGVLAEAHRGTLGIFKSGCLNGPLE